MTDITRLLASLERRSAHAKDFGDDITFVKIEDLDALVEALEKAQGMEAYWKTQCRGITDHCEELQARIAELEREKVALESVALAMRDEMRAEEKRIAELESRTVTVENLQESAYRAGLTSGWNLGLANNNDGFNKCLAAHTAGIKWEAE